MYRIILIYFRHDREARMTISITRPKNQTEDRKRGVSASELAL